MTTEKQELYAGKRSVYLVGKVKLRDDSFKLDVKATSGYIYSSANIGIETGEGNVIYLECMGGYSPKNPLIKTQNKAKDSIDVNWNDRLNKKVVEQVNQYKLFKGSLKENEVETFISQYDLIQYMCHNMTEGMEVVVRGQMKLSVYKGEVQRKFEITGVSLPYAKKDAETGELLPIEYMAHLTQTVLLDEDSFSEITDEEKAEGKKVIRGYAVDFISKYEGEEIKKSAMFPIAITVPMTEAKHEKISEYLFKHEGEGASEIVVEIDIVEGYSKSNVSSADIELSDELQELVDMGLFSEEEARAKLVVRGGKVSELMFKKVALKIDEESGIGKPMLERGKYAQNELFFYEQAINGESNDIPTDTGNEDDDTPTGDDGGDEAWMKELGV